MNDNVNGVVNEAEQLQEWFRRWVPDPYGVLKDIDKFFPPGKEKGRLDPCSFYCSYPRCFEEDLQQGWPMIESALEKYGVGCIGALRPKNICVNFIVEDASSRVFCFIPFLSSKKLIAASQTLSVSHPHTRRRNRSKAWVSKGGVL